MATPGAHGLERSIIEFCRFARENGLPAGVKEDLDALRAARAVGIAERERLKFALRAVLCSSKADWDLFEDIFEAFWSEPQAGAWLQKPSGKRNKNLAEDAEQENAGQTLMGQSSSANIEGEGKAVLGATAHERLKKADFSELAHADLADLERISMRLLQQMSLRLSRRIRNIAARGRIDLRRTIPAEHRPRRRTG